MKIKYFQRYKQKENVDTSNTMLMLSRLYMYNPDLLYQLLENLVFDENMELNFSLQEGNGKSIPDGIICQPSFKIVIETKLYNQFGITQLERHLNSFGNEDRKVLLTIDPKPMDALLKKQISEECALKHISHVNTTFKELIEELEGIINEKDHEIYEVFEDYMDYCMEENLIPNSDKLMRAIVTGTTYDINMKYNLYYDSADRGYSDFGYLGLYKQKTVKAIGKLLDVVTVHFNSDGTINTVISKNNIDVDSALKSRIEQIAQDAKKLGHNIIDYDHNIFVVDKFYETCFTKKSKYAVQRSKYFDLLKELDVKELPDTAEIAKRLNGKEFE